MNNSIIVEVFKTDYNASADELGLFFSEPLGFVNVISQVSSFYELRHHVEVLPILKCVFYVHDEPRAVLKSEGSYGCFIDLSNVNSFTTVERHRLFIICPLSITLIA